MEEANEKFREIQHAYEVLSDPHERAWYDDHRDAILRGADVQIDGTEGAKPDFINLWEYFTSACYDSFDDNDKNVCFLRSNLTFERVSIMFIQRFSKHWIKKRKIMVNQGNIKKLQNLEILKLVTLK